MHKVRWMPPGADFSPAKEVRIEVFCQEQGFSPDVELDEIDATAHHIALFDGEIPVAAGRIFVSAPGTITLGRIAVRKSHRGQGLGNVLVREMLSRAISLGMHTAVLDAQVGVIPFYEKLGFTAHGAPHYDGHILHRYMERPLSCETSCEANESTICDRCP